MDLKTSIEHAESTVMREQAGYPRLAQLLLRSGVRHYVVDTATGTTTHYGKEECMRSGTATNASGTDFDKEKIIAALRAVQARETDYPQFLSQIAAAGVQTYLADLEHHRVIYMGHGQRYEESFELPPDEPHSE